jgi:hypothetical protein
MKVSQLISGLKSFIALVIFTLVQQVVLGQDNGGSSSTTTTTHTSTNAVQSDWYASPWVWVIGAAVIILLIVALSSGSRRSNDGRTDKVTVTKTVRKDTDV